MKPQNFNELVMFLNKNYNYLIFRGDKTRDNKKDIDILIDRSHKIPKINFHRKLHFQYEEKHKGIVFVSQSALKRKFWNGKYYELGKYDFIRMYILNFLRKKVLFRLISWINLFKDKIIMEKLKKKQERS